MATGKRAQVIEKAAVRRDRMRALLDGGMSLTKLAIRYHISPARVHQILFPNGKRHAKRRA